MNVFRSALLTCLIGAGLLCAACADTRSVAKHSVATPQQSTTPSAQPVDPLPSWRDTDTKRAILSFVKSTTTMDDPGYIPPSARIATFDNDGTLWAEQPIIQLQFVLARTAELARRNPELAKRPEVKAVLDKNMDFFKDKDGEKHLLQLLGLTSTGLSPTEFEAAVRTFFDTAVHPKLKVPYRLTTYQPMLELLALLQANGFETWICSGGGVDFMRPISEAFYGIPPQRVIGSSGSYEVKMHDGAIGITKTAKTHFINDHEGKIAGILAQIGRVPVFVAGNERSGGDIAQLRYSQTSPYASFQLLIDHDDAEREFSYEEADGASLAAASAYGWHVVSIRDDWANVFPLQ